MDKSATFDDEETLLPLAQVQGSKAGSTSSKKGNHQCRRPSKASRSVCTSLPLQTLCARLASAPPRCCAAGPAVGISVRAVASGPVSPSQSQTALPSAALTRGLQEAPCSSCKVTALTDLTQSPGPMTFPSHF